MSLIKKWLYLIVPVFMLGFTLVVQTQFPQIVEPVQLQVFDTYQRLKPREYTPLPVKIIDIDEESLARLGQWPWPRTQIGDLIYQLFADGAAVLAFDGVFAEPDRTSPANVLEVWPQSAEIDALRERILELPDHDQVLADVIAQTNVVLGVVLTQRPTERLPVIKFGIAEAGDDPRPFLQSFQGAVTNLPNIEAAAAGVGSFNLVPDHDNIIRRVHLLYRVGEQIFPTLGPEILRAAQGASTYIIKSSGANLESAFGAHTGLNNVKIGQFEVPTDALGRVWLHYTEPEPSRFIPAWRVLDPAFDPADVEGHILILGASAQGLRDIRATPLNPIAAGAEIHVSLIEQILLGHYLLRPDWAVGAEVVYLLVLGIVLIVMLRRVGAVWCAGLGLVAIALAVTASWQAYAEYRWLVDPVVPSAAALLIYLASSLINFIQSETERRQVRSAFSQYLSPALVEQLANDPSRLRLGGETKQMTFLFCDIRGFTPIAEQFKHNPQGLTRLVNRFLTPMTDLIMARRGTIDKYMGDCIMAFWNAPLDDQGHAGHALEAALAMIEDLKTLNAELREEADREDRPFIPIDIGIGVNTGECVVGNMGSQQRFDYSVLGDAVNLAARLEGQSKTYGVDIVLGEDTQQESSEFATIELDLIAVKGKSQAVRVFTLLGDAARTDDPEFQELRRYTAEMLAAYRRQDWDGARQSLGRCRTLDGKLADLWCLYEERIAIYEADPPAPDWDGVFVATAK